MKKIAIILLTSFMLFITNNSQAIYASSDDITGHYFENYMREAIQIEIMKGITEGVYNPDGHVSRSEFAALIVRTIEKIGKTPTPTSAPIEFSDVASTEWYYEEVQVATSLKIINGYPDGTFAPDKSISRQEMAIMIMRTLTAQGIETIPAKNKFTDLDGTVDIFANAIKVVYGLQLMNGTSNTTFDPNGVTTRGQASAVLMRLYKLDPSAIIVETETPYKVARVANDGSMKVESEYTTYNEAIQHTTYGQVVLLKDKVIYMTEGYAYTNNSPTVLAIVYDDVTLKKERTYVSSGTELQFISATENAVKVKYGMHEGYIKKELVELVPWSLVKNRSYYYVNNGFLKHYIYDPIKKTGVATLEVTYAPEVFVEGERYYNYGGNDFYDSVGNVYEVPLYFTNLPLHLPTSYTAEELDRYLLEKFNQTGFSSSPLYGLGAVFKQMEVEYQVNALYLMAHAIHESAWGTSKIATDKFNIYGYKAYDSDAYNSAKAYASFEESIRDAAIKVSSEYILNGGKYYYSAVLGNKSYGMNVKYASDVLWGEKIAAHMFRADYYLGGKDFNKYQLGMTLVNTLNVRDNYSAVGTNSIASFQKAYAPFALVEQVDQSSLLDDNGAQWYNVYTDTRSARTGYIFAEGNLLGSYQKYARLFNKTY